jgi:hypothetical protein
MESHLLMDGLNDPVARWFLIAAAVVTILWAIVRPITRKKDPLAKTPGYASLAQQRTVERQMQNVLVDLSEMARQITAQLDTRAGKLELLIKEADEKIARLNELARTAGARSTPEVAQLTSTTPAEFIKFGEAASEERESRPDPRHAEVYTLADSGRSTREIAQALNRPNGEVELILALRR